jgi:hypothetical protein
MKGWMLMGGAALLVLGGCATHGPQRARLHATMTGIQEVPGPGDPGATGTAEIRVDAQAGRVCWDVYARGTDTPTAAHIHRGAAGSAGPPVVTLITPDASGHSAGCANVDPALVRQMMFQPYNFYVNVHTQRFPNGITRGQLRNDGPLRQRDRRDDDDR